MLKKEEWGGYFKGAMKKKSVGDELEVDGKIVKLSVGVRSNNMKKMTVEERISAWNEGKERERAKKGVPFDVIGDGSEPLSDERERWCQGVVAGGDEREVYWKIWKDEKGLPRSKRSTATSACGHLKRVPKVAARLAYLRRQNAAVAKVDREEKLKITEEVIQGLRADFRNGDRGKTVTDLMAALARHDAMCGEVEKPTLKIELGLGGLLSGIDAVVEGRLGLTKKPESLEKRAEKAVEGGEVVE